MMSFEDRMSQLAKDLEEIENLRKGYKADTATTSQTTSTKTNKPFKTKAEQVNTEEVQRQQEEALKQQALKEREEKNFQRALEIQRQRKIKRQQEREKREKCSTEQVTQQKETVNEPVTPIPTWSREQGYRYLLSLGFDELQAMTQSQILEDVPQKEVLTLLSVQNRPVGFLFDFNDSYLTTDTTIGRDVVSGKVMSITKQYLTLKNMVAFKEYCMKRMGKPSLTQSFLQMLLRIESVKPELASYEMKMYQHNTDLLNELRNENVLIEVTFLNIKKEGAFA